MKFAVGQHWCDGGYQLELWSCISKHEENTGLLGAAYPALASIDDPAPAADVLVRTCFHGKSIAATEGYIRSGADSQHEKATTCQVPTSRKRRECQLQAWQKELGCGSWDTILRHLGRYRSCCASLANFRNAVLMRVF